MFGINAKLIYSYIKLDWYISIHLGQSDLYYLLSLFNIENQNIFKFPTVKVGLVLGLFFFHFKGNQLLFCYIAAKTPASSRNCASLLTLFFPLNKPIIFIQLQLSNYYNLKIHMKGKLLLLFLCLIAFTLAQNQCQESRLSLLQTGEIILNPNDLNVGGNNTSNKNYYEALDRAKFGKTDFLGYAFAIAGFEASCTQRYYSLVVDVVEFQNQNTKMKVVIDFRNTVADTLTSWTKVKLSYLIASADKRQQGQNQANIWATSADIILPSVITPNQPYFRDDVFAGLNGGAVPVAPETEGCGLIYSNQVGVGYIFKIYCEDATPLIQRDIAIHSYIMGFRYEPDVQGSGQFLAASASFGSWPLSDKSKQLAVGQNIATDSAERNINIPTAAQKAYGVKIRYDNTINNLVNNGPLFTLSNYNGELKSIKIAIVLTTIMPGYTSTFKRNGFDSILPYSYSGLYNPVDPLTFNIRTLIDDDPDNDHNNLHENLPTAKYKIYGFSKFELKDGSGCSSFSLDLSIDTPNSFTITLNNKDFFQNLIFQGDIYFAQTSGVCTPGVEFKNLIWDFAAVGGPAQSQPLIDAKNDVFGNIKLIKTRKSQKYTTVPSSGTYQLVSQVSDNPLDLEFIANGITGDTGVVRFNAQIVMTGITSGKPYGIRFTMRPTSNPVGTAFVENTDGTLNEIRIKVNGLTVYSETFTAVQLNTLKNSVINTNKVQQLSGLNLVGDSAKFEYSVVINRGGITGQQLRIKASIDLFEFLEVYDPVTECCVTKCPLTNGLDVLVTPPVCVTCDASKGLTYNPSTGSCTCADTFYLDSTLNFQCFPCQSKVCAQCDPDNPKKCQTCLQGATLSTLDSTCSCSSGFYENNGVCTQCPIKCKTCKVASTCDSCSDTNRDINNGCGCITGYYDAGVDKCQKCSSSCATCANGNNCMTCDPRKFRKLQNGLCVCEDGFFELIYENGNKECKPCSSQCNTCVESAIQCTTCDPSINRVEGYDSLNHRTCVCKPGYHGLPDGSCVQSNCKTDQLCSRCETDLALCVQCRGTLNRVLKLPESICVCKDGFYEDSTTKTCKQCADGCAQCSSLTKCISCVAGATNNNDGTCTCAVGTFFGISTNDVRYCQKCIKYCDKCSDALTCQTCKSPFQLSSDKTCFCPKNNWIDPSGNCVPCKVGCQSCTSSSTCSKCIAPLVVQEDSCVVKCSDGYFLSGATCVGCPKNCVGCTSNNQCFYCKDGFFLHGGACYTNCPSGTVANLLTFQCVPCNSPCRTCTNHPSTCTSCEPGEGYLQVTGDNQKCVKECAEGTFPKDNVCQVCDFRCAKCLGASNNCIACPAGQFLYSGACWNSCPGILVNNTCVSACPAGYWKSSNQQCKPCSSQCKTCDNNSTCISCNNNFLSLNGKCVQECGNGYYSFRGICVACDKTCKSCKNIPTQCIQCAAGFFRSNGQCISTCVDGTYLEKSLGQCLSCSQTCKTCSSENLCLSCPNPSIVPIAGICYSCIYPCQSCSADLSVCNACANNFVLSGGQCLTACPSGTRPVNGVCSCSSGIFLDGKCVDSCPSGTTKVGSECKKCNSPCTECSGNQNFCTDCLDTFTLKPNTGTCDRTSNCNYGQVDDKGKCVRICEEGYYYQDGACIFGGCPQSYKDNGFGGCVSSSVATSLCQVPTFKLNSVCVEDCGKGFYANSGNRNCQPCASNCQSCLDKSFCTACNTGFIQTSDGKCLAASNCPSNQLSYNSGCVGSCPIGTFTSNGRCVRSCRAGTFYFGNYCYDTCPTQAKYFTDNACVATCPSGTTLIDVVCATIV